MAEGENSFHQVREAIRRGGYDQPDVPPDYTRTIEQDPAWQQDIREFVDFIPGSVEISGETKLLKNCTVLDVGAGPGTITAEIKDKAGRIIAVDKAQAMVDYAQQRFANDTNVEVVRGDFTALKIPDESVEVVVSAGTVYELPPEEETEDKFLSELVRVLKPGGVVILNGVCNAGNEYTARQFHHKRAEEKDLIAQNHNHLGITQRKYVFLSSELADRLEKLGYRCQVETSPKQKDKPLCDVKITLLEKIEKDEA